MVVELVEQADESFVDVLITFAEAVIFDPTDDHVTLFMRHIRDGPCDGEFLRTRGRIDDDRANVVPPAGAQGVSHRLPCRVARLGDETNVRIRGELARESGQ